MKKLLLLLLCVPLIGVTQDNCGDTPIKPLQFTKSEVHYRNSREYKNYRKLLRKYEDCIFQNIDDPLPVDGSGEIVFENVITMPDQSAEQIYLWIKEWFATDNESSNTGNPFLDHEKEIYRLDDKKKGKLVLDMHTEVLTDYSAKLDKQSDPYFDRYWITNTIEIHIREGRFKYYLSNFDRDIYVFNAIKTIYERQASLILPVEDIIINSLYDPPLIQAPKHEKNIFNKDTGRLNRKNAYLKLKILDLANNFYKDITERMSTARDRDNW
jgi:hypothetical protein